MKNVSMKNDGMCLAHFKQGCKCRDNENPKRVRVTFSSLVEGGTPICTKCEEEYVFVGVEIVSPNNPQPAKPITVKVAWGSESMVEDLAKQGEERPVSEYECTTQQDASNLLAAIDDAQGYLDYEVLEGAE